MTTIQFTPTEPTPDQGQPGTVLYTVTGIDTPAHRAVIADLQEQGLILQPNPTPDAAVPVIQVGPERIFRTDPESGVLVFNREVTVTAQDVADVAYLVNRRNDFPCPSGDYIPTAIALMHDEVDESVDEGDLDNWPAACAEQVDVIIRCMDGLEGSGAGKVMHAVNLAVGGELSAATTLADLAALLDAGAPVTAGRMHPHSYFTVGTAVQHQALSRALRVYRKTPAHSYDMPDLYLQELAQVLLSALVVLLVLGRTPTEIEDMVMQTIGRNAARGARHGGKRC